MPFIDFRAKLHFETSSPFFRYNHLFAAMDSAFPSANDILSSSERFQMQSGRLPPPRWARHEPEYPWIVAVVGRAISTFFTWIFKHFFLAVFLAGLIMRILSATGWPPIPLKPEFLLNDISVDEAVVGMWSNSYWDPRILTLITVRDCERIGKIDDWTKFFTETLNFTWCDLPDRNFFWCQCNDVTFVARIFASKALKNVESIFKRCSRLRSVDRWYPKKIFGFWETIFYGIMAAQCFYAFS